MDVYDRAVNNEVTFSNVKRVLGKKYKNLKDGNLLMIKYADALWQWREVKSQTDSVDQAGVWRSSTSTINCHFFYDNSKSFEKAIDREFQVDDTANATRQITSKLDQLEKIVKKAPAVQRSIIRQPTVQSIMSSTTEKDGSTRASISGPSMAQK